MPRNWTLVPLQVPPDPRQTQARMQDKRCPSLVLAACRKKNRGEGGMQ